MYVEDKVSHRGPFPIIVNPNQTVAELKKQIQKEFEIPANYQKWILGKELVTDDNSTLQHHNITTEGCPVFLYLVAPDSKNLPETPKLPVNEDKDLPSTSKATNPSDELITSKNETGRASSKKTEDKIERVRANVQNLQNLLNGSKNENKNALVLSKDEDHTPKIVNVIPKIADSKTKTETRIIPIQIEKTETKDVKKPITLTEIVIEKKSKIPVITTSQEVKPNIQYVFPTLQHVEETIPIPSKVLGAVPKDINPSAATPKEPPQANEDDFEDYDSKTLKPAKEWQCHLCTLLNPMTSNICAVCATVRLMKSKVQPVKKHLKKRAPQPKAGAASAKQDQTYLQLVNLDNADLVENIEPFECVVCFMEIKPGDGITLRECLHQFCKVCLGHTIEFAEEAEVKCPYRDDDYSCNIALQDREIKALVTRVVYEQHLAKSVAQAENKIDKSFHCKTPDCKGWCIFEDNVNEFRCPVCRKTNCLTCQAIHSGRNCKQYQEKMHVESEIDDDARRTKDMLEEMVNKGEAIECPTCKVILMKKWGCDWLRCSMCKTEICWVTRGPRWGPAGKGDASGGCQCGVNGVKCHPKCNYCH